MRIYEKPDQYVEIDNKKFVIKYQDNYVNQEWIYFDQSGKKIGSKTQGWLTYDPDHFKIIELLLKGQTFPIVYDFG